MKISFLIIACLISTLAAYEFANIVSFMKVDLGIEYRNGDKYIKLVSIERFQQQIVEIDFIVNILVKGESEQPETLQIRGIVHKT
jgi:hypothetical protein